MSRDKAETLNRKPKPNYGLSTKMVSKPTTKSDEKLAKTISKQTTTKSDDKPAKTISKPTIKSEERPTKTREKSTDRRQNVVVKKPVHNRNESRTNSIEKKPLVPTRQTVSTPKIKNTTAPRLNQKTAKLTSRDITSARVTKSEYFPKKYPFSARLTEKQEKTVQKLKEIDEKRPKLNRERTLTRILSPSEIKIAKHIQDELNHENRNDDNRPRTATIRKSTDNQEISSFDHPTIDSNQKSTDSQQNTSKPASIDHHKPYSKSSDHVKLNSKPETSINSQKNTSKTKSKSNYQQKISTDEKIVAASSNQLKTNAKTTNQSKIRSESNVHLKNKSKISTELSDRSKIKSNTLSNDLNPTLGSKQTESESDDYEDDFESYESDFEAYSSSASLSSITTDDAASPITTTPSVDDTQEPELFIELCQKRVNSAGPEDERKMDSGNYDLPDVKHKQILDGIKETIEKENLVVNQNESPNSLSDEGFEENTKYSLTNQGFINFADARKQQSEQNQKNQRINKRGHDLMNMIRLNAVSFVLFDMNPIRYDEFMQSYGRAGTIQISSQTGDDNLDEETQTDSIECATKWTQFPIRFSRQNPDEHFGVGSDPPLPPLPPINNQQPQKNLMKFMSRQGGLVLHILGQKLTGQNQFKKDTREIPFSEEYTKLNYERVPFLKQRAVRFLNYSKTGKLLTVHDCGPTGELVQRSMICVWNILELNLPEKMLSSCGAVSKACFDSSHGFLIFAGIQDGSVSVWDLRESDAVHRQIIEETTNEKYTMRCPTYTTIPILKTRLISSKMVAIQAFPIDSVETDQDIPATQICTLDAVGTVIIWSVIRKEPTLELLTEDHRLCPWGSVILSQGLTISLQTNHPNLKELQCFDLQFSEKEPNHLFITTNYGVLHCLTTGMKPKPHLYENDKQPVSSLELSPFSSTHFLCGSDGNIKLHSRFYEKPLMTLCNDHSIETIEWSNHRPCVFYVKDVRNFIHIWDLTASDIDPIFSISFNENITAIKLSPWITNTKLNYMAISTQNGDVFIHVLKQDYSQQQDHIYNKELKKFLNYVNRL